MKIWRWRCNRYLRNHGFVQCEKFEYLKFRHTEVIHKKLFLSFVKMRNCVWYLWTCPSQNTGLHNFGGQIGLACFFLGKLTIFTFVKVLRPMIVKCFNENKALQRIIITFSNFGSNWDNIGGFSLMGQGIGRSPALAKNLLTLFSTTKKNPPISRFYHQIFIPLHQITKYQILCFNQIKTAFLSF